jgi:hypothetical protein
VFQKKLSIITRDHLRQHIEGYIDEVNGWYDTPITNVLPKRIELASMAGGVFAAPEDQLPYYGVDCITKALAQRPENLYCYEYNGHIAGLVSAGSRDGVDDLVKAHAAAVELFVRNHTLLHQSAEDQFTILEFGFLAATFSGAEPRFIEDNRELWIAGFEVTTFWQTSEDGPGQHV